MKKCNNCFLDKPLEDFWPCRGTPDGRQYECSECMVKHTRTIAKAAEERDKAIKASDPKNYDAAIVAQLYYMSRKRAKQKSVEHTITKDDIKLVHICPIRNVTMSRSTGKFNNDSYTLDRVDSSRGYVPGNVRVISWKANNLKSDLSVGDIVRLLAYMKGEL